MWSMSKFLSPPFFPYSLWKSKFSKDPFEYRNISPPKGVSEMSNAPTTGSNNHNLLLSFCLQMLFSYISKYCNAFTNHCGHLLTHTPLNLQTLPSMYKGRVKKTSSQYNKSKNRGHPVLHFSFQTPGFDLNLKAI